MSWSCLGKEVPVQSCLGRKGIPLSWDLTGVPPLPGKRPKTRVHPLQERTWDQRPSTPPPQTGPTTGLWTGLGVPPPPGNDQRPEISEQEYPFPLWTNTHLSKHLKNYISDICEKEYLRTSHQVTKKRSCQKSLDPSSPLTLHRSTPSRPSPHIPAPK